MMIHLETPLSDSSINTSTQTMANGHMSTTARHLFEGLESRLVSRSPDTLCTPFVLAPMKPQPFGVSDVLNLPSGCPLHTRSANPTRRQKESVFVSFSSTRSIRFALSNYQGSRSPKTRCLNLSISVSVLSKTCGFVS